MSFASSNHQLTLQIENNTNELFFNPKPDPDAVDPSDILHYSAVLRKPPPAIANPPTPQALLAKERRRQDRLRAIAPDSVTISMGIPLLVNARIRATRSFAAAADGNDGQTQLPPQRPAIYLTAVHDTAGFSSSRLNASRAALNLLVDQLEGPEDRLSFISFERKEPVEVFPLIAINQIENNNNNNNKADLKKRIEANLEGVGKWKPGPSAHLGDGMWAALRQQLPLQKEDDTSATIPFVRVIVCTSMNIPSPNFVSQLESHLHRKVLRNCSAVQIYTFGFTEAPNAQVMKEIADVTKSSFYPIFDDADLVRAYGDIIASLSSVAARNLRLKISVNSSAPHPVEIRKVFSGEVFRKTEVQHQIKPTSLLLTEKENPYHFIFHSLDTSIDFGGNPPTDTDADERQRLGAVRRGITEVLVEIPQILTDEPIDILVYAVVHGIVDRSQEFQGFDETEAIGPSLPPISFAPLQFSLDFENPFGFFVGIAPNCPINAPKITLAPKQQQQRRVEDGDDTEIDQEGKFNRNVESIFFRCRMHEGYGRILFMLKNGYGWAHVALYRDAILKKMEIVRDEMKKEEESGNSVTGNERRRGLRLMEMLVTLVKNTITIPYASWYVPSPDVDLVLVANVADLNHQRDCCTLWAIGPAGSVSNVNSVGKVRVLDTNSVRRSMREVSQRHQVANLQ